MSTVLLGDKHTTHVLQCSFASDVIVEAYRPQDAGDNKGGHTIFNIFWRNTVTKKKDTTR